MVRLIIVGRCVSELSSGALHLPFKKAGGGRGQRAKLVQHRVEGGDAERWRCRKVEWISKYFEW